MLSGGCICEAVRFEVSEPLEGAGTNPEDPVVICVRLGALDDDPGVRPSFHQYADYAAPWEPIPDDGLPRFPERMEHQ